MTLSTNRRKFFLLFGDTVLEYIEQLKIKNFVPKTLSHNWILAGQLSSMLPGSSQKLFIDSKEYVIESDNEGIWIENDKGERFALETRRGGSVFININQLWPKTRILSQVTGEAVERN